MAAGLLPTAWVSVVLGYAFGWPGFGYAMAANLSAALLAKALLSSLLKEDGRLFLSRWHLTQKLAARARRGAGMFVFLCRLSPVLPFATTNVVLTLVPVGYLKYGWWSFAGMLPRTVAAASIGVASKVLVFQASPKVNILLVATLLIVSCYGLWRLFRLDSDGPRSELGKSNPNQSDDDSRAS
ncbi:VTT domain-containing protein [Brevifollis gellanilyticus]|uniref:VTT domain-containing protein n=1 Tax=Brevifollis gellanilyticus TaxID=748831 RepID=UPI003CCDD105